ncbi:MAG: hypothetical protein A3G39_04350 [Deltaproteobacteria bacterium RIFCSPLOWO2_12_FULL_43_16]|nr:MAG: hypothetical protein A2Z89_04390 [Deltaproteobacteria bacterium GWA2_43_19]OGQ11077.1 MAG: hypothetical protein A3D30_00480 [Deltaproteobacteria bacterium RIFCSPHIGHO2_02_FULL_43_33]OGQ34458.1 MAG: hypothetical protein A3A85_05840 [Deltaproteobacteria bacterium RIFCSPLOWO2_01_FULL_42_9]OGQ60321.1 MAG: hypothetical protein A3G39_04350 [Deltaproteobacteria bacterium RIFCSPLOWO2_12_FULL_43_16]HBR18492.1 hypothetical protein [Deltaproteobacteria bacterium]
MQTISNNKVQDAARVIIIRGLILLFFLVLVYSCNSATKDPEVSILETNIRRYNRALIDAYKELSVDPLQEIASEREMGKVNMIIMGFRAKNQYMESELKGIEFKEIKRNKEDSADVETKEAWRFRYMDKKTGQEVKPWAEAEYKLSYHIIKNQGKWLVGTVEFVKEKK